MAYETYKRPAWVRPGEQWQPGRTQEEYERGGGILASGFASVLPPPTPPTPPGGDLGGDEGFVSRPGYESDYWKSYGEWAGGLTTEFGAEDEATIRADIAKQMQAQIDAVNEMYGRLITREEEAGVGRLGRTRAIGARAGLLGSPMGEAQMEETRRGTAEQVKFVEAERDLRLQAIFGKIDERAEEEIRFKKAEAMAGTEARLTYMREHAEAIKESWGGLASSGITLERIKANEEYYGQALEELGMDELQFDLWYESKMPVAQQLDFSEIQYEKDGNIWLKRIGFDPATGEKKEYNYDLNLPWPGVAVQYKHTQLDDGTVLFIPETLDPDKTLEEQIIMYGAKGEFAKPKEYAPPASYKEWELAGGLEGTGKSYAEWLKDEEGEITEKQAKTDMKTQLMTVRGADGYISPGDYKRAKEAWFQKGLSKDKFDEYFEMFANPSHIADYEIAEY